MTFLMTIEGMRSKLFDPNEDRDWIQHAVCRGLGPREFYPDDEVKDYTVRVEDAQRVCVTCTVRVECLEYALKHNEGSGVWGGASERERRRIARRRRYEEKRREERSRRRREAQQR